MSIALLAAHSAKADYTAKVQAGTLTLTGDPASDKLALRLAPADPNSLEADVGDDGSADFTFPRNTFTVIDVLAGRGNDEVRVDQSFGSFHEEHLTIYGGSGNDNLRGGSGAETLLGGSGNDDVGGGDGDDVTRLGAGTDSFLWNPGDDNDSVDGDDGNDALDFNGAMIGERIDIAANGQRVRLTRDIATITMDLNELERVAFEARGGADTMSRVGNLAALTHLTFDGAGGNDTLSGGNGADLLRGGSGNDFADGQQGADVAQLGSGNDTFQWDPGDGNDTVEGEGGSDSMAFNGSSIGELLDVSANGDRVRFTRNIANIVMDLDDVERIGLRPVGGSDTATVGDMSGTDLAAVDVDLSLADGSSDPVPDTIVVNGTEKRDVVRLARSGDQVQVNGLAAQTRIAGSELLSDTLRVQTHGGDDSVLVSPAVEELITPVIDLGADE